MAFQSQTYGNSNSGYYVESAAPINPSTITALNGPVEILFTSTIAGAYHGTLNQTPSTFIISENDANLSTINSLVMDPTVPKTTMNIYNVANPNSEPVIQQWSHTSSIVNGIFKIGNKQLNDEPNALDIINSNGVTTLTQVFGGGPQQTQITIDGNNQRTRIGNTQTPTKYSEFTATFANSGNITSANDTLGFKITTTPDQQQFIKNTSQIYGRTGVNSAVPNQYYMSARSNIDFTTDELGASLNTLSLKQNGTANFISTVFAPTVSTTTVNTVNVITTDISTTTFTASGASYPDVTTKITPDSVFINDTSVTTPRVKLEIVGGQGAVTATTVGRQIRMIANTNFSQSIVADGNLFIGVNAFVAPGNNALILNANDSSVNAPVKVFTPLISTISSVTINGISAFSHKTPASIITNANSGVPVPGPYPQAYGNFQGQFYYNNLRSTFGAPATAFESLEVVNVSGGAQTGGIQFYTSNNNDPTNPKWMGGFLQNNVGAGQSELRLASTVTASMPQLVNISTINAQPITAYTNPVGTILSWAGYNIANVPQGYLLCDGSQVSIATYTNLYNTIGSWGTATAGNFRLPDSRGKTLIGSVTIPGNSGPNGVYSIQADFLSLVTINRPSSWNGGAKIGMAIANVTGQLYIGMMINTPGFDGQRRIEAFINSDGLYGNITPIQYQNSAVSIILFDDNYGTVGPTNTRITFEINAGFLYGFPYIRNSWGPTNTIPGVGNYNQLQHDWEVASHTHTQSQPGGGASQLAGGIRAGDPNIGGPQTSINTGLFNYIDPITSVNTTGPAAKISIPYNMATWQIIKF